MLLKWQWSISIFSQIWRYSKYESKKIFSMLSYCRQLWQFLEFLIFKIFVFLWFFYKTENVWQNLFLKIFFTKWRKKTRHQKNKILITPPTYKFNVFIQAWFCALGFRVTSHCSMQNRRCKMPMSHLSGRLGWTWMDEVWFISAFSSNDTHSAGKKP
jgi:hypothetical protein